MTCPLPLASHAGHPGVALVIIVTQRSNSSTLTAASPLQSPAHGGAVGVGVELGVALLVGVSVLVRVTVGVGVGGGSTIVGSSVTTTGGQRGSSGELHST